MATVAPVIESRPAAPERNNRKQLQDVPGIQSVVLSPGGQVEVINISNSGILVRTPTRVNPDTVVRVRLVGTDGSRVAMGRTVRCEVVGVGGGGLQYQLAIAFNGELDLIPDDDPSAEDAPGSSPPDAGADGPPPSDTGFDLPRVCGANAW